MNIYEDSHERKEPTGSSLPMGPSRENPYADDTSAGRELKMDFARWVPDCPWSRCLRAIQTAPDFPHIIDFGERVAHRFGEVLAGRPVPRPADALRDIPGTQRLRPLAKDPDDSLPEGSGPSAAPHRPTHRPSRRTTRRTTPTTTGGTASPPTTHRSSRRHSAHDAECIRDPSDLRLQRGTSTGELTVVSLHFFEHARSAVRRRHPCHLAATTRPTRTATAATTAASAHAGPRTPLPGVNGAGMSGQMRGHRETSLTFRTLERSCCHFFISLC